MPSRKTFTVMILCFAVVISAWLLSKSPVNKLTITNGNTVSSEPLINLKEDSSGNWKKILTEIDSKNEKVVDLTKNNEEVFDETTLTAQLARDFMSQYLLVKGANGTVSESDVNNLTNSVLSVPQYSQTAGAVYIMSNIKTVNSSSLSTLNNYKSSMTAIIKDGLGKVKAEPHLILGKAVSTNDERILSALDPIIKANRTAIEQLLVTDVPLKASRIHLDLMNSLSNMLVDIEAMRVLFIDPVKSLSAINQYPQHRSDFINALNAMSSYLASI